MPDNPIIILALVTLGLVLALLIWNYRSVRRNQATGGKTSGIGGPNDPMA
jgi:hypothetical protein